MFVEFCDCGSLKVFLKEINASINSGIFSDNLLSRMMINWVLQTVDGMKFLSENKIIHGDLSTRNLLLRDVDTLKISGFGFKKQRNKMILGKSTKSVKEECNSGVHCRGFFIRLFFLLQQNIPWRRLAPETLLKMEFSVQSDIWGFGVTIFEIYSLGETPYSNIEWTEEFVSLIESGMRLEKPLRCPQEL